MTTPVHQRSVLRELTLLVFETKETHEYDRERVLEAFYVIAPLIPKDDDRGYGDHDWLDDDGRIITLFELLNESILGDMLFGCVDWDSGSDLTTRREDE